MVVPPATPTSYRNVQRTTNGPSKPVDDAISEDSVSEDDVSDDDNDSDFEMLEESEPVVVVPNPTVSRRLRRRTWNGIRRRSSVLRSGAQTTRSRLATRRSGSRVSGCMML